MERVAYGEFRQRFNAAVGALRENPDSFLPKVMEELGLPRDPLISGCIVTSAEASEREGEELSTAWMFYSNLS